MSIFPPFDLQTNEPIRRELDAGNRAFEVARAALDSSVERQMLSVYDISEALVDRFDFGVIGTFLHHLRDPVQALRGIRSVLDGRLLTVDAVVPGFSSLRRLPRVVPLMLAGAPFWWLPNPPALRKFVEAAGFEVEGGWRAVLRAIWSRVRPRDVPSVYARRHSRVPLSGHCPTR